MRLAFYGGEHLFVLRRELCDGRLEVPRGTFDAYPLRDVQARARFRVFERGSRQSFSRLRASEAFSEMMRRCVRLRLGLGVERVVYVVVDHARVGPRAREVPPSGGCVEVVGVREDVRVVLGSRGLSALR